MFIPFACSAFIFFLLGFGFKYTKKYSMWVIPYFILGNIASTTATTLTYLEFRSFWISLIVGLSPLLLVVASWWIVKTVRPHTTTTLVLMSLMLVGCNRYVEPEASDSVPVLAKVEDLKVDGSFAHFKVRLEGRTLIYNEGYLEIRQSQIESLHNDDQIMIVKRGLQYFWTTGGKLIPFN